MKKSIKVIAWTLVFLFNIWVFASFCDVVADNNSKNPIHGKYNFFVLMTND